MESARLQIITRNGERSRDRCGTRE